MKRTTLLLLILTWVSILTAQSLTFTVSVSGAVKNPNGTPVPNATLVVSVPAQTPKGFNYAVKVQTGNLGGYEHKINVPSNTPLGKLTVELYNCDGKLIIQSAEFALGKENKIVIDFVFCKDQGSNVCAAAIVTKPSPDAATITLGVDAKGKAPFTYLWSTGQTTETIRITPVPDKRICVTVTDAAGCKATPCFTFPSAPKCSVVIKQAASGELIAQAEGKGPFTYKWSTNETTAGILPKAPGEYCVEVNNAENCKARYCFKVLAPEVRCSVEIGVTPATSTNAGWKLTALAKGTGPFKYYWDGGVEGPESITVTKAGNYCVTVIDNAGCKTHACRTAGVDANCKVGIEPGKDPNGKVVKLTAVASGTGFSFVWSTGAKTAAIEPTGPGRYCVTATNDAGCKATQCFEILDSPKCSVVIKQAASGELIAQAEGKGPFTYKWSTNETTVGILPKAPGEYCVEVNNAENCKARYCFKVLAPEVRCSVEIGVTPATSTNAGWKLTALAKGTGPFKYYWDGGVEGPESITVTKAGNYCVTVIDNAGCKTHACRTVGVDANCKVGIEPGKDPNGKVVKLTAVASGTGFSFVWSTGAKTAAIEPTGPGRYCVTATNDAGCKATQCFEILATVKCSVAIKQTASGELAASPAGKAPFKYSWSTGETTAGILPKAPGEYCVKVIDADNCIASACFRVIGADVKCAAEIEVGPSTTVNSSWKLTAHAKGVAPFKYAWDFENKQTQSIEVPKTGTYCVTVTDAAGCTTRVCRTIAPAPDCKVSIEVLVDPASPVVVLKAIVPSNDYIYKWSTGEDTPFIIPKVANTYCVTVTNSKGCKASACFRFESKMSNLSSSIEGFVSLPIAITVIYTLKGRASLYYLNQPTASSIRVAQVPLQITKEGKPNFYSFGRVPAGKYLVRITLDEGSTYAKEYLPTYYGDVINWNAGSVITVPHDGGLFNVMMVKGTNAQGPGNITGSVTKGSGLSEASADLRGGEPVKEASILLVDSHDNPLSYSITTDKGEFNFRSLPYGTYKVMIDVVGMEPEWKWVTLSSINAQVSDLNFNVSETSLTNVADMESFNGFKVYPNPARDLVTVSVESVSTQDALLRLTTMTGQTVHAEKVLIREGNQHLEVNISQLPSGLYFLNLTSGQKTLTAKVVKE